MLEHLFSCRKEYYKVIKTLKESLIPSMNCQNNHHFATLIFNVFKATVNRLLKIYIQSTRDLIYAIFCALFKNRIS